MTSTHVGPRGASRRGPLERATAIALVVLALDAAAAIRASAQEAAAGQEERIVVTGSRIVRRDFQANSPIVTVSEDAFENRSSVDVADALEDMPQFVTTGEQGGTIPGPTAAIGASLVNLRGLGTNRNLVLVNGRRPQPVNATLAVDVNSIPAAAIENVETITGGAGAVYGADAISGVVNFILKKDFEGLEVDAQYGVTEKGDGETTQLSGLVGGNFDDGRGNAMLGLVYSQRGNVLSVDRDFTTRGWRDPGTTGGQLEFSSLNQLVACPALPQFLLPYPIKCGPGAVGQYGINPDGSLFDLNDAANPAAPFKGELNAGPEGSGFHLDQSGALTWNNPNGQLQGPLTRYSGFSSAHYDLTDSLTVFGQLDFTQTVSESRINTANPFDFWSIVVPYDARYDDPDSATFGPAPNGTWHPVSRQVADLLNSRSASIIGGVPGTAGPWVLERGLTFLNEPLPIDRTTNTSYQFTTGLEGELPFKDWTFEVYGSHGKTHTTDYQNAFADRSAVNQIIQYGNWGEGFDVSAINNAAGQVYVGIVGTCTSGVHLFDNQGNVAWDPVGQSDVDVSADCSEYMKPRFNAITDLEQNIAEANVQGGLFDLPAGEVRFALGAAYREEDFFFNPDSGANNNMPTANIPGQIAPQGFIEGGFDVSEGYGELLVPVLSDLPGVRQLDLELGYRSSNYSNAGVTETYKILGDWSVTDFLRFRGGFQKATRAPNIAELYSPITTALVASPGDPCGRFTTSTGGVLTTSYGNRPDNPNVENVQQLCSYLMESADFDAAGNPKGGGPHYLNDNDDGPGASAAAGGMDHFNTTALGPNTIFTLGLGLTSGNPNLKPEEAETWTAGFVLTSPFQHALLDRLSLSVDWYQIELEGAIGTPAFNTVYSQCLDPQYNPLIADPAGSHTGAELAAGNKYCYLINRESPSGIDRTFDSVYLNQGGIQTSGVDVQVNWGAELSDLGLGDLPGAVSVNVVTSILGEYAEQPFEGGQWTDYKGTTYNSSYDYRLLATLGYTLDTWSLGARARYLPEVDSASGALGAKATASHTEVDLFGRWALNDRIELRGGVDNVSNEQPEVVGANASNNALNSTSFEYDQLGRRYYVGVTARY